MAGLRKEDSRQASFTQRVLDYRRREMAGARALPLQKSAEEGGCGVVGFAASIPVRGRHIFEPSIQMHNRGNGKGGGIAAAGFLPEQLGVDAKTLKEDYIIQVALVDPEAEGAVEAANITPCFEVDHKERLTAQADWRELGMPVKPPDVVRYFVRAKQDALGAFAAERNLAADGGRALEDEFVYWNSRKLNDEFYSSLGEKQAFVLSHARNLVILKVVGYAEHVVQYYGMEDMKAKVWIAHQRYPTKGRVWHPGGSHPFIGMNEALVHNGDFANYYAVAEYLRQHGIETQFLTDTEVSALLFDLLTRIYHYPLEYLIEAIAPTTELDFTRLPAEKQPIYRALQAQHLHGSPDGPWFFIVARSEPEEEMVRLLGITDTSMLRPQVFAIQEGEVSIGLVGSEKQAIDATLRSLHEEDPRFGLVADRYWNARGGSHTDGGAFIFSVGTNGDEARVVCTDKFGRQISGTAGDWRHDPASGAAEPASAGLAELVADETAQSHTIFEAASQGMPGWSFANLDWLLATLKEQAAGDQSQMARALDVLTLMGDRRYDTGGLKRRVVLELVANTIEEILDAAPSIAEGSGGMYRRIDRKTQGDLRSPEGGEKVLVVMARDFPPEGDDNDARLEVAAYEMGWKHFIVYGLKGQRFHGCGLGPETEGVCFDLYGSSGDYISSGMDGLTLSIHGNAQDQLGQIMKSGILVIYGDVGQAFMYGAKGGEVYIMGNGAGRPLINAVGKPRVVINGTCLDFLAESFMAGDPLNGGGFVVLNGMGFDDDGKVRPQELPYPGSNLFSLASGGAIYVRDPYRLLVEEQLNGGAYFDMTEEDWQLILPYLEENERLFGISIEDDLLVVDGQRRSPLEVYRRVGPRSKAGVLKKEAIPE